MPTDMILLALSFISIVSGFVAFYYRTQTSILKEQKRNKEQQTQIDELYQQIDKVYQFIDKKSSEDSATIKCDIEDLTHNINDIHKDLVQMDTRLLSVEYQKSSRSKSVK